MTQAANSTWIPNLESPVIESPLLKHRARPGAPHRELTDLTHPRLTRPGSESLPCGIIISYSDSDLAWESRFEGAAHGRSQTRPGSESRAELCCNELLEIQDTFVTALVLATTTFMTS